MIDTKLRITVGIRGVFADGYGSHEYDVEIRRTVPDVVKLLLLESRTHEVVLNVALSPEESCVLGEALKQMGKRRNDE
jgi:hypothetical protein